MFSYFYYDSLTSLGGGVELRCYAHGTWRVRTPSGKSVNPWIFLNFVQGLGFLERQRFFSWILKEVLVILWRRRNVETPKCTELLNCFVYKTRIGKKKISWNSTRLWVRRQRSGWVTPRLQQVRLPAIEWNSHRKTRRRGTWGRKYSNWRTRSNR